MSNSKNFYFTFGYGQEHEGHYVVISATSEDLARKEMFRRFGPKWSMCYSEDRWFEDGISQAEKYNYKELDDGSRS